MDSQASCRPPLSLRHLFWVIFAVIGLLYGLCFGLGELFFIRAYSVGELSASRYYALLSASVYPFERRFRLAYPRLLVAQTVVLKTDIPTAQAAISALQRSVLVDPSMADLWVPLIVFKQVLHENAEPEKIQLRRIVPVLPAAVEKQIQ